MKLDLNKDYIHVCVESIIKYNGDNFNIFVVNDDSFRKLLNNFDVNINNIPEPIKSNVRKLGMCELLHKFGGMCVAKSFLCTKCLMPIYREGIKGNKMFCVENINRTPTSFEKKFLADDIIMGCNKNCEGMRLYKDYVDNVVKNDGTSQSKFLGVCREWLELEYEKLNVNKINGRLIGLKDSNNVYINMEKLFGVVDLNLDKHAVGIYVDEESLDKRHKFNWFNKLCKNDIFRSDTQIGNHMLLSHGQ